MLEVEERMEIQPLTTKTREVVEEVIIVPEVEEEMLGTMLQCQEVTAEQLFHRLLIAGWLWVEVLVLELPITERVHQQEGLHQAGEQVAES
jgi:hypothetical protein